jgi:hypothetical protein
MATNGDFHMATDRRISGSSASRYWANYLPFTCGALILSSNG